MSSLCLVVSKSTLPQLFVSRKQSKTGGTFYAVVKSDPVPPPGWTIIKNLTRDQRFLQALKNAKLKFLFIDQKTSGSGSGGSSSTGEDDEMALELDEDALIAAADDAEEDDGGDDDEDDDEDLEDMDALMQLEAEMAEAEDMDSVDRMELEYEEEAGVNGSESEDDAAVRDQQLMVLDYDYEREVEEIEDANAINAYNQELGGGGLDVYAGENDYMDYNNDNYWGTDVYPYIWRNDTSNKFRYFQNELEIIQGYFQELASGQKQA